MTSPAPDQLHLPAEPQLPTAVYLTADVREFDRLAIEEFGLAGFELMTRAGHAALAALRRRFPDARSMVVICGGGNNAGDGYIVARRAADAGMVVRVVALVDPVQLRGDAARAWSEAEAAGVVIAGMAGLGDCLPDADVIVDAIFGTGLSRAVGDPYAAVIRTMNESGAPVMALDVPSGLDSDSGAVLGIAVHAALTVTFVGLKSGLYLGQGPDCCGRIEFAGLGVPGDTRAQARPVFHRLLPDALHAEFSPRRRMSHKSLNGNVLLIGGSPGMAGAIRLSAEAALRAGAGLVHVATHPDCVLSVMSGRPELMCRGVVDPDQLQDWLGAADAIVLGPGLGLTAWSEALFERVIETPKPLIVDADGLNWLARLPRQRADWLLTPHPGEAARLLATTTAAVQGDRLGAIRALADRFAAGVILKGACSLTAESTDQTEMACFVCDRGNPGMATAGMGDVLAGIAGATAAQRRSTAGVGPLATLVHALAGDDAAVDGERGLIASDLLPYIRARVNPH